MTPSDITQSLAQGFNIVCATCPKLYRGLDTGHRGCVESMLGECGGPLSGRNFPLYTGQIPRDRLNEICLVCGTPENLAFAVYFEGKHHYSLCKKDRKALEVLPSIYTTTHKPLLDRFHV